MNDRARKRKVSLMLSAKRLKHIKLIPGDPKYDDNLHFMMPFFQLFEQRFGLSSSNLFMYFATGNMFWITDQFRAIDFDDWCRCLHKMSFMTVSGLSYRLQELQKENTAYATLICNLAQSVYLCLLYWYLEPSMLLEFIREASMNKSKYIDILSIHDLCHIRDWITIPTDDYHGFLHKGASAQVFSRTYEDLLLHQIDPYTAPCCSIPLKMICGFFRRMIIRPVIDGQEIDEQNDKQNDVILKTLTSICLR